MAIAVTLCTTKFVWHNCNFSRTFDFKRKQNQGFALAGLLALMPLLCALSFASAALIILLKEYTSAQTACDQSLFQIEAAIAQNIQELLALNPRSYALSRQHKIWRARELAAIASHNEAAEIYAARKLADIEIKQSELRQKQEKIKMQAERSIRLETQAANRRFHSYGAKIQPLTMQVRPDTNSLIAPAYLPVENFTARQSVSAALSFDLDYALPPFIKKVWHYFAFQNSAKKISLACAASIEKRGWRYLPTLYKERR